MDKFSPLDAIARLDAALADGSIERDTHFIHAGSSDALSASIVNAVALLECLSPQDGPSSPADIPAWLLPPAVAWGLMTVADEVSGRDRVEIARCLRCGLEDGATPDQWMEVARAIASTMTRLSVETMSALVTALDADDPMLTKLAALAAAWEHNSPQAVVAAAGRVLGVPAAAVFTDPAINEIVDRPPAALDMLGAVFSGFTVRLAVWSARSAYCDHAAIRRGILDLDFATVAVKTALAAAGTPPVCDNIWDPLKVAALDALRRLPTVSAEVDIELPKAFSPPRRVRRSSSPSANP